jgi:lipoprotein-anchoring transpeptidase ErfK/SrfK
MRTYRLSGFFAVLAMTGLSPAHAETYFSQDIIRPPAAIPHQQMRAPAYSRDRDDIVGSIPPARRDADTGAGSSQLAESLRRQLVAYGGPEAAGTIIIDTDHTHLYFVLGQGQAIRYGVGVGRDGFRWSGRQSITRVASWPDWHPPSEMIERQPYLPRFMAGGPGNPLGARALYLGDSVYRIHGTNDPTTIGQFISSGCIRLLNQDIEDLYARVGIGTTVIVLPSAKGTAS